MLNFVFILILLFNTANGCSWDNCPKWSSDPNIINVHIIAHSHDDMGWIKTVDDYYTGRTKTLVNVGVEYIFNTVIEELNNDPTKRFSFAEVGYLTRWLEGRPLDGPQVKLFKKLVNDGQIEFIGGGWVQPDEAASHYVDLLDLYTLGFDKLAKNFDDCGVAKIAWQIDPFGHSREHANLAVQLGHQGLFHGRMHFNEQWERIFNKSLEYIWQTSEDVKTNIFTSAFYSGNYAPPRNFCFDTMCFDSPVVDDPKLEGYNLPTKVTDFITTLKQLTAPQRHNHFFLSIGSDFHFSNANIPFTSWDRLIKGMNEKTKETGFNVFYSTPYCYVSTLSENPPKLPIKTDDHYPYASGDHSYWTGYFTSKPEMKRMIRQASSLLHSARSMRALANLTDQRSKQAEEKLERAIGLAQHHDAITGTSKEKVTQDYELRMKIAANGIQENMDKSMQRLQTGSLHIAFCNPLNLTACEEFVKHDLPIAVTIFNTNTHPMNTSVRIPFFNRSVLVQNEKMEQVSVDVLKSFQPIEQLSRTESRAPYQLQFQVELPPLGYRTYFLTKLRNKQASALKRAVLHTQSIRSLSSNISLENSLLRLNFDQNGVLQEWIDKTESKTYKFQQAFHYYKGFDHDNDQRSGAYIFRPDGTLPFDFDKPTRVEVVKGKTFEEVRQVISPWVSQTIRVQKDSSYVEFEFVIGPIPKEAKNPIAKEVITRYNVSDINSNGVFYTDANGRQFMKRTVNTYTFDHDITEPIAGNYYPVTSTILLKDNTHQLTVLTDRSQGGASFSSGNIDIMLHRRCFKDDSWGVEEALDEPGIDGRGLIVTGKHLIQLGPISSDHRLKAHQIYNEPILGYTPIPSVETFVKNYTTKMAGLINDLPPQVKILTLKLLSNNKLLLRVEHIFQTAENDAVVNVDLTTLFTGLQIEAVDELMLGANKAIGRLSHWDSRTLKLTPMQIRTFELTVSKQT